MIKHMHASLRSARDEDNGFTLIELMVVIIIIGILAAIAIPAFLNQRTAAWDSSVKSDLSSAVLAVESYATANNGSYAGVAATATYTSATATGPLITNGFLISPNNTITVTVTGSGTGYTLKGSNSNAVSGGGAHYYTVTNGKISATPTAS